jgi:hypothetical protein
MYASWADLHLREPLSGNSSLAQMGEPRKEADGDAAARRSSRSQEVEDNLLPAGNTLPCCSALGYPLFWWREIWRSALAERVKAQGALEPPPIHRFPLSPDLEFQFGDFSVSPPL